MTEVSEAALHIPNGDWMLCRLLSNSPDSFKEGKYIFVNKLNEDDILVKLLYHFVCKHIVTASTILFACHFPWQCVYKNLSHFCNYLIQCVKALLQGAISRMKKV